MVHFYSVFIQGALQRLQTMQGTNLLIGSNLGFRVLLKDSLTLPLEEPGIEPGTLRVLLTATLPLSHWRQIDTVNVVNERNCYFVEG